MDSNNKSAPRGFKREEGQPKNGPGDDIPGRIAGLEKARAFPEMTPADVAALDRAIAKLKEKQEALKAPRVKEE
jgi:hypothetical protein